MTAAWPTGKLITRSRGWRNAAMKIHCSRTWITCLTLAVYLVMSASAAGSGCWCCISGQHHAASIPAHHGDESSCGMTPSATSHRHLAGTHEASAHEHVCKCCGCTDGASKYSQAITAQTTVERPGSLSLHVENTFPQIQQTNYIPPVPLVSAWDFVRLRSVILII